MHNIVIFGAPGSGKGTQSDLLIEKYDLFHISTGDLLRDHIARGTDLGKIAESFISKGQLIPDDLMVDILADFVDSNAQSGKGLILDGFPRTIPQAEALKKLLSDRGKKINHVIGLEVPDDELMTRLVKRGKDSGRSDDNPETIAKRLDVYHSQTYPLREYYVNEKLYRPIKAVGDISEIFDRIVEAIGEN